MEGLEQDADPVAAEEGQPVLVERGEIDAVDHHPPAGGALDAADDGEQARLAGARGTDHAQAGAGVEVEVDAVEDAYRASRAGEGEMHVIELDHPLASVRSWQFATG